MADYSDSRSNPGGLYPENVVESDFQRLEPLITPDQFRQRFVWGIPLVSAMRDPVTNKAAVISNDMLKDLIDGAVNRMETTLNISIMPIQRKARLPFDRALYEQLGYFVLPHKPIASIESLTVVVSDNEVIYTVPQTWISASYLARGQCNIVPLVVQFSNSGSGITPTQSAGGSAFLALLSFRPWLPTFWEATYTTGYPDGRVPRVINELVGTEAALDVLSMLASTHARSTGHSLSLDGGSQSVSSPGPNLFASRIQELNLKKAELTKKVKSLYNQKIFVSTL